MHVAGLPRKLPSAMWKLWPPSLERKMNDCVVLKPNGGLVQSCPVPSIATSGSNPGWQFEAPVGVAKATASAASAPARRRSAAATRVVATRMGGAEGYAYQACDAPQCGQSTEVETAASHWKPHGHV